MSVELKTQKFFEGGSPSQFEWVLTLYDQCLRLKAESKSSKPENVIKLDKWYQNELPKKIKSRGKDPHLVHEEMVQAIKWKLGRGKYRPNLVNLVQMNTPRVVMTETKKAFRNIYKREDLQAGVQALCNLKGVGPAMASAVLAAGAPHMAPYMADECLLAMGVESLDYTMKEYMRYVEYVNTQVERLKAAGGTDFTPHKVELAVWTHFIACEFKPELLEDMPGGPISAGAAPAATAPPAAESAEPAAAEQPVTNGETNGENGGSNGSSTEDSNHSTNGATNGTAEDESSRDAAAEDNSRSSVEQEEEKKTNGSAEHTKTAASEPSSVPSSEETTKASEAGKRPAEDDSPEAVEAKKAKTSEPAQPEAATA